MLASYHRAIQESEPPPGAVPPKGKVPPAAGKKKTKTVAVPENAAQTNPHGDKRKQGEKRSANFSLSQALPTQNVPQLAPWQMRPPTVRAMLQSVAMLLGEQGKMKCEMLSKQYENCIINLGELEQDLIGLVGIESATMAFRYAQQPAGFLHKPPQASSAPLESSFLHKPPLASSAPQEALIAQAQYGFPSASAHASAGFPPASAMTTFEYDLPDPAPCAKGMKRRKTAVGDQQHQIA